MSDARDVRLAVGATLSLVIAQVCEGHQAEGNDLWHAGQGSAANVFLTPGRRSGSAFGPDSDRGIPGGQDLTGVAAQGGTGWYPLTTSATESIVFSCAHVCDHGQSNPRQEGPTRANEGEQPPR